jgi:hypothetical protein
VLAVSCIIDVKSMHFKANPNKAKANSLEDFGSNLRDLEWHLLDVREHLADAGVFAVIAVIPAILS